MEGPLIDVIDRLGEVDDPYGYRAHCIFAEGGPDAPPTARAVVCPGDKDGSLVCPRDPTLSYVLMVDLANDAIEVWSEWRSGRQPSPAEKFAAVMHYARHDAYLPIEPEG